MSEDINALINKFENAVQRAWIYDTKIGFVDGDYGTQLKKVDQLFEECAMVKEQLLMAVKQLTKANDQARDREIAASWERNPDRMGGQFTQEEIDRSRNGGW